MLQLLIIVNHVIFICEYVCNIGKYISFFLYIKDIYISISVCLFLHFLTVLRIFVSDINEYTRMLAISIQIPRQYIVFGTSICWRNTNPTKKRRWTLVLQNGKHFPLHLWHSSCYSCYKSVDMSWM
jgi:hypothetical protein